MAQDSPTMHLFSYTPNKTPSCLLLLPPPPPLFFSLSSPRHFPHPLVIPLIPSPPRPENHHHHPRRRGLPTPGRIVRLSTRARSRAGTRATSTRRRSGSAAAAPCPPRLVAASSSDDVGDADDGPDEERGRVRARDEPALREPDDRSYPAPGTEPEAPSLNRPARAACLAATAPAPGVVPCGAARSACCSSAAGCWCWWC